jgi:hypothetical protein
MQRPISRSWKVVEEARRLRLLRLRPLQNPPRLHLLRPSLPSPQPRRMTTSLSALAQAVSSWQIVSLRPGRVSSSLSVLDLVMQALAEMISLLGHSKVDLLSRVSIFRACSRPSLEALVRRTGSARTLLSSQDVSLVGEHRLTEGTFPNLQN